MSTAVSADLFRLPHRQRLAILARRSAEYCDDVGAWASADLFRRLADEVETVERETARVLITYDEEVAL